MIRVTFLKVWRMYQPGEIAAFEPHVAEALIAGQTAVLADAEEEPVASDTGLPAQGGQDDAARKAAEDDAARKAAEEEAAAKAAPKGKAESGLPKQGTGG